MDEFINRQEAIEQTKAEWAKLPLSETTGFGILMRVLTSIPAADVRPVEWIPVTERLPNVDEKVLTFARNKYDGSWFMDITSWTGVRNHDEYRFWGYGDSMKVTHWMSLPEPPKEV